MKKIVVLFLIALLVGCGREGQGPVFNYVPSQIGHASKYPYFFTLLCDGRAVTVTIRSASEEPAKCPL